MTASTHAIELVAVAAAAADSKQATDLVALDVSATLPLADAFNGLCALGRHFLRRLARQAILHDRPPALKRGGG